MKTVKEVSKLTGVSVRALHHYDTIGLLKPTQVTEAGYRLYDDTAVEKLYMILLFKELGLQLQQIADILHAPDYDRNSCLEKQINLMQERAQKLQDRIALAKGMLTVGVNYMDFEGFDPKKVDDYSAQAKALYGKTDAYKEFSQKSAGRTKEQEKDLGAQVMDFFAKLGKMRPCDPGCEEAQAWAKELQAFFTANYYTCTPQILSSLAESYAGGGSMTENIDKVGGTGTGAFAKEVIDIYIQKIK
ncbi:MAG: MerR family transcriptional regulator [Oscillospiraceae bacterium]|nr:MerR family transcriptional regulator [Oscillospiraceae bacterium]